MTPTVAELAGSVAGHIREPHTLSEILRQIESNDYSAELLLQHLLRWVADNIQPGVAARGGKGGLS